MGRARNLGRHELVFHALEEVGERGRSVAELMLVTGLGRHEVSTVLQTMARDETIERCASDDGGRKNRWRVKDEEDVGFGEFDPGALVATASATTVHFLRAMHALAGQRNFFDRRLKEQEHGRYQATHAMA